MHIRLFRGDTIIADRGRKPIPDAEQSLMQYRKPKPLSIDRFSSFDAKSQGHEALSAGRRVVRFSPNRERNPGSNSIHLVGDKLLFRRLKIVMSSSKTERYVPMFLEGPRLHVVKWTG